MSKKKKGVNQPRRTVPIPKEVTDAVLPKTVEVFNTGTVDALRNTRIKKYSSARQAAAVALQEAGRRRGERYSLKAIGEAVGIKSLAAVSLAIKNVRQGLLKSMALAKLDLVRGVLPARRKPGRPPRIRIPANPPPTKIPSGVPETLLPPTTPTPYAISAAVLNSEIFFGTVLFSKHLEKDAELGRHVAILLLREVRLKEKSEKTASFRVAEELQITVKEVHEAVGHIRVQLEEGDGWLAVVLNGLRNALSLTS